MTEPAVNRRTNDEMRATLEVVTSTVQTISNEIAQYRAAMGPSIIASTKNLNDACSKMFDAAESNVKLFDRFVGTIDRFMLSMKEDRDEYKLEMKDLSAKIEHNTKVVSDCMGSISLSNQRMDTIGGGLATLCTDIKSVTGIVTALNDRITNEVTNIRKDNSDLSVRLASIEAVQNNNSGWQLRTQHLVFGIIAALLGAAGYLISMIKAG